MPISEKSILELVAFLLASARLLETEPRDYGQMRLMAAAARVCDMTADQVTPELGQILARFADAIPEHQPHRLREPEAYLAFIDDCCRELARYLQESANNGD